MAEEHIDLLKEIWDLTTKISEESLLAASEKAQELKFDIDKGVVGFAETRINLIYSRDLIADAIKTNKLVQLPVTIQRDLHAQLSEIVQSLTALANGTDEIVLLADRVEKLTSLLWQYGFHNLSNEVLGYAKKINQLKSQEVAVDKLLTKLHDAEAVRESALQTISQLEDWNHRAELLATDIDQLQKKVASQAEASSGDQLKVAAAYASVQQTSEDAARLLSTITTSSGQATTLKDQIADAFSVIDPRKAELAASIQEFSQANLANQTVANALLKKVEEDTASAESARQAAYVALEKKLSDAAAAVNTAITGSFDTFSRDAASNLKRILDENAEELAGMKSRLLEHEGQIKVQIERAIGVSLFGAFQKRQDSIVRSRACFINTCAG
jgi:hypothetical protein